MSKEFKKEEMALTREAINTGTIEEVQNKMEADVVTFAEEINTLNTPEELKEAEKVLMEVFKDNDEYLQNVEYELGAEVEYDGQKVKRSEIVDYIIYFINKLEVEFKATLGIYQAIRYWKAKGANNVPYTVFDSTLRMLGTLKFQGETDCFKILVVNNWFAGAHDKYIRDNTYINYLATKHQVILKRLGDLEKPEMPEEKE